jgi:hypothetical protein
MEEEIICNRWKDLADGPKVKEKVVHQSWSFYPAVQMITLPFLSSQFN